MKSSLKNMILTLLAITLVSSLSLGLIYQATLKPIQEAKDNKIIVALKGVLPEFDNNPAEDITSYLLDEMDIKIYTGRVNGKPSGYAVETQTKQGFSGLIKMMVGFKPNGEIVNIEVLEHAETPGLGDKIADPDNPLLLCFAGKNPADIKMTVKKDGGDIDVLTASTISSRAYTDAVQRAYNALLIITKKESGDE